MLESTRSGLAARIGRLINEGDDALQQAEELAMTTLVQQLHYWNHRVNGRVLPIAIESLATLDTDLLADLFAVVTGFSDPQRAMEFEINSARSLFLGIRLAVTAPEVAFRDCHDCQAYVYDELSGERVTFRGEPVRRPPGTEAPCRMPHVGCLRGTPETAIGLSSEQWQIWWKDREYRAIGKYPDDPLVGWHAAIIHAAEQGR